MARKRIDELDALAVTDIAPGTDESPVSDTSAVKAKRVTVAQLLNSYRQSPVSYAVDTALTSADAYRPVDNNGAAASRTFTLPAGFSGAWFLFYNASDVYTLSIDPNGTEIIGSAGAGKKITMLARGWLKIVWNGSRWEPVNGYGDQEYEP